MPMYVTCPICGSNNDPGEKCDCERKKAETIREPSYLEQVAKDFFGNIHKVSAMERAK